MSQNSLVSILIPTYNRCDLLKRALDCAVNQTYKNIEIIIGDNHSEDGTEELCLKHAKNDNRIKYTRHNENLGLDKNGEFVLKASNGVYVFYLNDDDWVSENYIEEAVKVLDSNSDAIGVNGTINLHDENNMLLFEGCAYSMDEDDYISRCVKYATQASKYYIATGVFRADAFKSIQAFNEYRFCEDQLFIMKLIYLGKMIIVPDMIFHKTANGCTKDLETLKEYFKLPDMTYENYWYYLAREYMSSVLYDKPYNEKLSKNERIDFALELCKTIEDNFKIKVEVKHKSFGQKIIDKIRGKKD